jgi:hypothetical protein
MIALEGPKVVLGISTADLKAEINDLSKLGELLPEGAVIDFASDNNKCSFRVKAGIAIHLEKDLSPQAENVLIKLNTVAPTPVKFSLEAVAEHHESGCSCSVRSDADLNPFTKMMVEPALKSLFEEITEAMKKNFPIA